MPYYWQGGPTFDPKNPPVLDGIAATSAIDNIHAIHRLFQDNAIKFGMVKERVVIYQYGIFTITLARELHRNHRWIAIRTDATCVFYGLVNMSGFVAWFNLIRDSVLIHNDTQWAKAFLEEE